MPRERGYGRLLRHRRPRGGSHRVKLHIGRFHQRMGYGLELQVLRLLPKRDDRWFRRVNKCIGIHLWQGEVYRQRLLPLRLRRRNNRMHTPVDIDSTPCFLHIMRLHQLQPSRKCCMKRKMMETILVWSWRGVCLEHFSIESGCKKRI